MISFKKFFTLIELIVVIVVLGILAAIVIPNISSMQQESKKAAIESNVRNLQTSVDIYSLDYPNDKPTYGGEPAYFDPKPLNFEKLTPDYNRSNPKTKGVFYWLDYMGTVWASEVDAPTKVEQDATDLTWEESTNAVKYKIYKVEGETTGSIKDYKNLKFVAEEEDLSLLFDDKNPSTNQYAVSAVDINGFETPAVKSSYLGYNKYLPEGVPHVNSVGSTGGEGLGSGSGGSGGLNTGGTSSPAPTNSSPTAVITMTAPEFIYNDTVISWNHTSSTDPNGDAISNAEWKNKQDIYPIGTHTVEMRVQDTKGAWSEWTSKTFEVVNRAPEVTRVIMTPSTNLTTDSVVSFNYQATDADGHTIQNVEWQNKLDKYPQGMNTVKVRVQDSLGQWSNWKSHSFYVTSVEELSGTLTANYIIGENAKVNYVLYTDDQLVNKVTESGWINTQTLANGSIAAIHTFTGLESGTYYVGGYIDYVNGGEIQGPIYFGPKTVQ